MKSVIFTVIAIALCALGEKDAFETYTVGNIEGPFVCPTCSHISYLQETKTAAITGKGDVPQTCGFLQYSTKLVDDPRACISYQTVGRNSECCTEGGSILNEDHYGLNHNPHYNQVPHSPAGVQPGILCPAGRSLIVDPSEHNPKLYVANNFYATCETWSFMIQYGIQPLSFDDKVILIDNCCAPNKYVNVAPDQDDQTNAPEQNNEPSAPEQNNEPSAPEQNNEPSAPEQNNEPSAPEQNNEPSAPEQNDEPSAPEETTKRPSRKKRTRLSCRGSYWRCRLVETPTIVASAVGGVVVLVVIGVVVTLIIVRRRRMARKDIPTEDNENALSLPMRLNTYNVPAKNPNY